MLDIIVLNTIALMVAPEVIARDLVVLDIMVPDMVGLHHACLKHETHQVTHTIRSIMTA